MSATYGTFWYVQWTRILLKVVVGFDRLYWKSFFVQYSTYSPPAKHLKIIWRTLAPRVDQYGMALWTTTHLHHNNKEFVLITLLGVYGRLFRRLIQCRVNRTWRGRLQFS
jgi:hypothetical protein